MGRVGRAGARFALLLVSITLSLAFLEGAFRLYEQAFLIHEAQVGGRAYDLHRFGYNDYEGFLERARTPSSFRILSFGDSFAQSVTLPAYTYAHVLEKELSRIGGSAVRVVNFGRSGTSFADYRSQLAVWTRSLEYDGVLIGIYAGNDFTESTSMLFVENGDQAYRAGSEQKTFVYGLGRNVPERYPFRALDYLYAWFYTRRYAADSNLDTALYRDRELQFPMRVYRETQVKIVDVYRAERADRFIDAHYWLWKLAASAAEIELAGKPVAMSVAPAHFAIESPWLDDVLLAAGSSRDEVDLDLPAQIVTGIARAAGFAGPIIDLRPCLVAASREGISLYWGTNSHWSVAGNEVVGGVLARELSRAWLREESPSPGAELAACPTAPPPAPEGVRRTLDASVGVIRNLLAFEDQVLSLLAGRGFRDIEALTATLEQAGMQHDSKRIIGKFWGFRKPPRIEILRLHGVWRPVRPAGWARDVGAPGETILIAFFHLGRLIGVGRTSHAAGKYARFVRSVDARQKNLVFESVVRSPGSRAMAPDEWWVVAIAPSGRFATLPPSGRSPTGIELPY
jgi:hypothetical protein